MAAQGVDQVSAGPELTELLGPLLDHGAIVLGPPRGEGVGSAEVRENMERSARTWARCTIRSLAMRAPSAVDLSRDSTIWSR